MQSFHTDKISHLAFDVDGTLFSSENMIANTYQNAIENYNKAKNRSFPVPDHAAIMAEIGKPVKKIFENLLPIAPEAERNAISDSVLDLLCRQIRDGKGEFYDKVAETIKALYEKKFTLVLASNGRGPYLDAITESHKIDRFFEDKITIDNVKIHSKGDILKEYMKKYRLEPGTMLMIGDRFSDYEAAVVSQNPFAWCEFGHGSSAEIPEYALKLGKISDLLQSL